MSQKEKKIDEILREAAAAVADSDVTEDLRSVAFVKAVDLIAGASYATDISTKMESPSEQQKASNRGDIVEMISGKFETEINVIEEAFEVKDEVPQLTIPRSRLAEADRAATKQIALLVAAARQAAEVEDWTESNTIRESVKMYSKYNGPNFAAAISELDDDFSFLGKGQSRRVKVRRDGFKSAGRLVKQLLEKSEK